MKANETLWYKCIQSCLFLLNILINITVHQNRSLKLFLMDKLWTVYFTKITNFNQVEVKQPIHQQTYL
jgi:hypothetical protein